MSELAQLFESKVDLMITAILTDKLSFLDTDHKYSPRMTQSQVMEWLKIGDATLKDYFSRGMPVVYKPNSDKIDFIPRDAVKDWMRNEWRNI